MREGVDIAMCVSPGFDDRLHNSGGPAPVQHRTPALGARFALDYMALLQSWSGAPPEIAKALARVLPRHGMIPAALVGRCAHALACALGFAPPDESRRNPVLALMSLGDAVEQLGLVRGVVLVGRPNDLYKERMYTGRGTGPLRTCLPILDEHVAVALTTVVSCSPPLVLWGREPSLAMLRADKALRITRLRREASSHAATRVWSELQAICEGAR